ncbi:hypothetical protein BJ165DRAFT_254799 [Panaeolus papilionaceus]|nr:hypothetical protein BJ165DRAFT_254799 [Panaeolus papilionaceus]
MPMSTPAPRERGERGEREFECGGCEEGVGEGGLPSVCVTFATSSASGSGSSGVCEEDEGSGSGSGTGSGSASGRGSGGSKRRRRRKRRGGESANSSAGADMNMSLPRMGMRDISSTNVSTIPSMYSMPSYVSAASTMQASTRSRTSMQGSTSTKMGMQASAKTLSPRASMGTMSSPSDYSCESYMGSESSFFAADVIEREREMREGRGSNSNSRESGAGGRGGYLSTSSGGNSKKSMDGSFLSLDLSGSEGSGSDDTSRGVGVREKKDVDGGSFIEFGEDMDSDGLGGEGGKERRKRGIGMTSTPPRRDHRGKKRASVVLFRGSGSASPVKTNANGNEGNLSSSSSRSLGHRAHTSPNGAIASPDGGSFKAPSIASRSDISFFSGSTHFEFAPVVESTGGSGGHAQSKLNGKGNANVFANRNGNQSAGGSGSGYHAPDSLAFPSSHHHSNQHRGMEPSIRIFDVDGDSLLNSSIGHGGGGAQSVDAMSLSARSVDAFSVDAMSVNSDDTDYIPFLPLVLQHERLQKTLRKPVSMEAVVSANEAGRGVARSVRSVASMASMNSMASARSGSVRSGQERNGASERDKQRRSSAVRLDPRSAHAIASKAKAAARLGISPSEVSLAAGSASDSSKRRFPAHVSESIAGVCIPASSNASRAPSICSSVGTEESVPVRGGPGNRASGMTLRVQTDLDLGARRVVVCGSGLDAGVEDLREGRISVSSEDGAGSVVISEDAQSQRGTIVDGDEDALEVTPTPTPRATVFAVNTLEVTPSVHSTPSTSSSQKTFIGPQALSPQPSIGSIRRTPSRQALKATPPRAPPSDPLPLPPLSPSATSCSSSGSDNRAFLSSTVSGSASVSTRLTSDVNSVSSGTSVSMVAGERVVGASSPKAEKKAEEGKKGRMRLSVQNPKDLWRARKKASAVGVGPEPRRDATSSANMDIPMPSTPPAVLPAGNAKIGVVFPTSRSLSFSSPSSQNLREKQQGIDGGDVAHQDQDRDIDDGGDEDCASSLREKEGSSRSTPSLTQSDDEERASGDDDDESIDLDSDSMRQLLAANTSANAAMHSNLDVHKIGMGRQVIIPSPPKKKKSAIKLQESERLRTRSCLGVGIEWTLGLGETQLKDEETIPARHASHSNLLKKVLKPEPEPEVPTKRASRLSDAPSTSSRARTKSESSLRTLDSGSTRSKKTRSVLPDFNDWTLSLPLPSPRDFERSRKVSELGASIGLASTVGEKSKEKQQTSHRHSTAPTASRRHTLDQKKRRASHHPIVRAEDVDSGVDLEATRGDDEPSESDEDDLRTPPLNTYVAQAFVVPRVVSVVDSLALGDSMRTKRAEVEVLDVRAETDVTDVQEQLEEDTHATRVKSNLAKLDALSADLKRFNELLRSGHPGSGSRKSEASLRSVSSQKGSMKGSMPPESHPDPGPFSYSINLKHTRSCEPFESKEPAEDTQSPPKNALFRTSCANLRESVLSSLPASDNESENEEELEAEGDLSDLSISTLRQRKTSQSSMKRRSQPRISLSKSRSSLSPVIQSPSAAEEDINCSTIDVMDVETQPTGFAANAVFGPAKWGKSSSLGRSVLPGQSRTSARAPLPFAPPVESTIATSSTAPQQNITNERRPKKLSDGIADISPTLRNAVSSIELGRMVPITIPAPPIPTLSSKKSAVHIGEQRETAKLAPPQALSSKKLAAPPNLSVQIAPMRRSSIILSDMTPTSTTSSTFPTPLASSFPIPPNTLPSLPLDFELGAKRMAQIVPPTPPAPLPDSRSVKSQKGRPSTSSSSSTITESVVQRMKERLESLGKNASKSASPASTSPAEFGEPEDTDQSSLCSGAYYSARSSFSEERRGD